MAETEIRECQTDDLTAVAQLLEQLADYASSHGDLCLADLRRMLAEMEQSPGFYANYVAVEEAKVIGFLSMIFYKTLFHRGGTALINELVVASDCRGRGIGRQLMETAQMEARRRGMDEIEVGTELSNRNAQAFYKKCGFDEEYLLLGLEF